MSPLNIDATTALDRTFDSASIDIVNMNNSTPDTTITVTDDSKPRTETPSSTKVIIALIVMTILIVSTSLISFTALIFALSHTTDTTTDANVASGDCTISDGNTQATVDTVSKAGNIPEVTITTLDATLMTNKDLTMAASNADIAQELDGTNVITPDMKAGSEDSITSVALTESEVHVYRHVRPTFDIVEVSTPTTISESATRSTNFDNDYFGGLASDILDFKSLQKCLEEDQMWLAHMPTPNPAITSGSKPSFIVKTNKIAKAARPAPKINYTSICKLSMIQEEDEEEIEFPRSSSDEADSSIDSLTDFEEFSESEEEIIAFAKKVHRLCDELEKVERFSDPVEETIALAKDIEATFQQWDEEDLEAFSDSEDDAIALAKQIEVNTRPSPPDSPTPQTPEGTGARFTESGFLIETPDHSPAQRAPISSPAQTPEAEFISKTPEATHLPHTPLSVHAQKPIFASPVGLCLQHIRKVSNETNTTEETNDTAVTQATNPTAGSPTTIYSSPDNVTEYQAMTGFTVCLSAKKGTGITFDPIVQPGDDIHYDRRFLKDETPSPSPARCRSSASNQSTPSDKSEDMSTPYDYTHHSGDSDILAVLKHPGGASYAKMSCGNWFFLNDDGTLDELNWREYEELIEFIVGDVASLPSKLHQVALHAAANTTETNAKNVTEPVTEDITAEVAGVIINSDQPDEKWFKAEEMPPRWFVMEHIRCPGEEISYYAEYVRGSDDRWYFRLDGPEYRPLDARELRWFLNWRASTRPLTYIVELEEEECF
ncbi:hypothetical protein NEUTE1DRAFT_52683 [Neurospora tetrasperma FGSC 2508]|uniref:Uncharacterized protein n=1 Tax=Neurospora tetrasperma (strain FGSC 2508 / ATCC MYA-4615 / P0657) TaxID=510951 RepID=F8N4A5_NEUT8|nr:uncharacterized protein NEUTE1DRAFT_52683 [Neurospora tetrasperma FGSC 2508]EGO51848.1 hypothetical protein NEUTE1DRAFT_52683 [Neurospora tetrasperma FGSC 2508]